MIYITGVSTPATREAGDQYGLLVTPQSGYAEQIPLYHMWAADNGCFSQGDAFDPERWLTWLAKAAVHRSTCKFAVLPDVVGDAAATVLRSSPWLTAVRDMGLPIAWVLQNGVEDTELPWDDIDCVFIGGDDAFKEGAVAYDYVDDARRLGKWVHMGRVNTLRRLRIAADMGCDSVDGTYLKYGNKEQRHAGAARLLRWVGQALEEAA